jgi:hypothetical protein
LNKSLRSRIVPERAQVRKSVRRTLSVRAIDEISVHKPEKRIKTEHIVRCARDVSQEKAEGIRKALEDRFPTRPVAEFNFKLTPLTVGAWLLSVGRFGDSDYDILGCDCSEVEVTQVLASADVLVARWREKHFQG